MMHTTNERGLIAFLLFAALSISTAGCQLVADFDRSLIVPDTGTDAGTVVDMGTAQDMGSIEDMGSAGDMSTVDDAGPVDAATGDAG